MLLKYKKGLTKTLDSGVAIFLFEEKNKKKQFDLGELTPIIAPVLKDGSFTPSFLKTLPVRTNGGWVLLVGLGQGKSLSPQRIMEASAKAVSLASELNIPSLGMVIPTTDDPENTLELMAEGALLSQYRQTEFKGKAQPDLPVKTIIFRGDISRAKAILQKATVIAEAVNLARHLGDSPPNVMYPENFAKEARNQARGLDIKVKVLGTKELLKERLNLIEAVGRESIHAPQLAVMEYRGAKGKRTKPIVLVGKGVTFDSGGISLKPSGGLMGMKTDMAGAASVLAVMVAVARLQLPINLTVMMPLAENMPGGNSYRVGDILVSRSGRTVEITNTDAEGRLLLADTLSLAGEAKPELIVDVATLTGACAVALGDRCAGLFTDHPALESGLVEASRRAGEAIWPLPLLSMYDSLLKSDTADLTNAASVPRGGAITAALFLRHFVPPDVPWAHLDIAGPARSEKSTLGTPAGATGFVVRTLLRFLEQKA